jgi:hypothetical protein
MKIGNRGLIWGYFITGEQGFERIREMLSDDVGGKRWEQEVYLIRNFDKKQVEC